MNDKFKIEVLDPSSEPIHSNAIIAPRPETLNGIKVGLLANGKPNSDLILEMVYEILSDQVEFGGVVFRNKGNASKPCPESIIDDLVDNCGVVITSSGD